MKKIQDLPSSVTVTLEEDQSIRYPKKGDFEECFELELLCFNKKSYLKTWPLRQRVMQANTDLMPKLSAFVNSDMKQEAAKEESAEGESLDVDGFITAMMMAGFDAISAMEEFKQLACTEDLLKLDDDIYMNKERWSNVDDDVKELVMFTYLLNFIQPCVL